MAGRWAKGLVEDRCSRRAFLRAAGATAALASFGTLGCLGTTGPAAGPAASVTTPSTALRTGLVVAVDEDPAKLVDRALDAFGGLSGIIKKGDRVVVKANYSFKNIPESSNQPDVLARIMQHCSDAGASSVTAVDYTIDAPEMCLAKSGIKNAVEAAGFKAIDLNTHEFIDTAVNGSSLRSCRIVKDVLDADVFVNVPVVKSHGSTLLTASMKNLMGIIRDRGAFHSGDLDACIADLAAYAKPSLVIADAYRVLRTGGPQGGADSTIDHPHALVVGRDMVAVDAYAASFLGLKPEEVPHIMAAYKAGAGQYDLSKMDVKRIE
jgi:uncharacterized protein (DUF362 family)